jgi:hypothetical protein
LYAVVPCSLAAAAAAFGGALLLRLHRLFFEGFCVLLCLPL